MYNEHRMNLRHKRNKNGMNQMFNGGEAEIRSVAAHNVHEKTLELNKEERVCCYMGH